MIKKNKQQAQTQGVPFQGMPQSVPFQGVPPQMQGMQEIPPQMQGMPPQGMTFQQGIPFQQGMPPQMQGMPQQMQWMPPQMQGMPPQFMPPQFDELKLKTEIERYFKYVIKDDFFLVALDRTGCYLFTTNFDDNLIENEFALFRQDMALTEQQATVCVIGRRSKFNYCDFDKLSIYTLQAKQKRALVLRDDDIKSILACYDIEEDTRIKQANYAETGLFKVLQQYRDENQLDLSDFDLNDLCRQKATHTPYTLNVTPSFREGLRKVLDEWNEPLLPSENELDFSGKSYYGYVEEAKLIISAIPIMVFFGSLIVLIACFILKSVVANAGLIDMGMYSTFTKISIGAVALTFTVLLIQFISLVKEFGGGGAAALYAENASRIALKTLESSIVITMCVAVVACSIIFGDRILIFLGG